MQDYSAHVFANLRDRMVGVNWADLSVSTYRHVATRSLVESLAAGMGPRLICVNGIDQAKFWSPEAISNRILPTRFSAPLYTYKESGDMGSGSTSRFLMPTQRKIRRLMPKQCAA